MTQTSDPIHTAGTCSACAGMGCDACAGTTAYPTFGPNAYDKRSNEAPAVAHVQELNHVHEHRRSQRIEAAARHLLAGDLTAEKGALQELQAALDPCPDEPVEYGSRNDQWNATSQRKDPYRAALEQIAAHKECPKVIWNLVADALCWARMIDFTEWVST